MRSKAKLAIVIATYTFWPVVLGLSVYFPFVRSPELNGRQLLLVYWWFYLPAFLGAVLLSVLHERARR